MPTEDDKFKAEVENVFQEAGVLYKKDVSVTINTDEIPKMKAVADKLRAENETDEGKSVGKTYEKIEPRDGHKIYDRLIVIRDKYHGHLRDAGVDFTVLLVHAGKDQNGDPVGPALKHTGYPAMAVIKKTSLKERVAGLGDAILTVDGDKWDEWTDAELDALLDHEMCHLELIVDKNGAVVRDDAGRPKLKIRLHDFEIGGFHSVAKKHKEAAAEVKAVATVGKEFVRQGVFAGF